MQLVAILLKSLREAKENESYEIMRCFTIELLDTLFEEISSAMESNDFKESQRRITHVKFVAEAYNYQLIHTDTLFDLLYRFINYDIQKREDD